MNFNNWHLSNGKIRKFISKKALPFGIKNGDFIYVTEGKTYHDDLEIPFKPLSSDKEFFSEIKSVTSQYKFGDDIMILVNLYNNTIKKGEIFKISDVTEDGVYITNNSKRLIIKPNEFKVVELYWFISSEMNVHFDIKNRNVKTDKFRMNSNNMFITKDEASLKLFEILSR